MVQMILARRSGGAGSEGRGIGFSPALRLVLPGFKRISEVLE